jgi:tRNA dimethylallyltransferase
VVRPNLSPLPVIPPLPIKVVVLGGPTATGKTATAIRLAERFDAELINGDSVQMVRGFDLGSAKATPEERARARHHLLDRFDPRDDLSAGDFVRLALETIREIAARGRRPIVVGGTGFYLRALVHGLDEMPQIPVEVRDGLARRLQEEGLPALRAELERRDPDYAGVISQGDTQRTLRALEVLEASGRPFSSFHRASGSPSAPPDPARAGLVFLELALTRDRAALYERINARVLEMMDEGFLDEVRGLVAEGYDLSVKPMRSLGYRQLFEHLRGLYDLPSAVRAIQQGHRRYAKRQLTWFRGHGVPLVGLDEPECLDALVEAFYASSLP